MNRHIIGVVTLVCFMFMVACSTKSINKQSNGTGKIQASSESTYTTVEDTSGFDTVIISSNNLEEESKVTSEYITYCVETPQITTTMPVTTIKKAVTTAKPVTTNPVTTVPTTTAAVPVTTIPVTTVPVTTITTASDTSASASESTSSQEALSASETTTVETSVTEAVPIITQVQNVPLILQNNVGLATGCEIVSATMLANYYGYPITANDSCKYLKIGNTIHFVKLKLCAVDPNIAFVGDPTSAKSYGCYAPVIEKALNNIIFAYRGKHIAKNISGCSSETLFSCINNSQPVVVWATMQMRAPGQGTSWITEQTNKKFTWIKNEHAILLIGYDENYIYANDPIDGYVKYDKKQFLLRWEQLGKQAVIIESAPAQ